ncbi:MAG: 16S rRNA (guanine(527)-N(7))-methyltransferase RsmG [Gammaproteobacteria bacterium]|nr:16S rRNA (guanine(527)-N(7))-methyltransferase RsmG [Gammaproteobacteria bacterium]
MASKDIAEKLQIGLDQLELTLNEKQKALLLDYLDLLIKWNKAFNLSGVKDSSEMLSRHLLDSLTLVPFINGRRILDVGTGPGLPGIPLAICFPEKNFVLLDSNGKKTRFVFQAKLQLGLDNIDVQNERIEKFHSQEPVDIIVCRAFSSLADLVNMTRHLTKRTDEAKGAGATTPTKIIAMKGQYPTDELAMLPDDFKLVSANKVDVPGSAGERHIIEMMASELHPIG